MLAKCTEQIQPVVKLGKKPIRLGMVSLTLGLVGVATGAAGANGVGDFCQSVVDFDQVSSLFTDLRTAPVSAPEQGTENQGRYTDIIPSRGSVGSMPQGLHGLGWTNHQPIDKEGGVSVAPLPTAAFAGLGLLIGIGGVRLMRSRSTMSH